MQTRTLRRNIFLSVLSLIFVFSFADAQDQQYVGPIVMAQFVEYDNSAATLVFQDVGTERSWTYTSELRLNAYSAWVPDGCHVSLYDADGHFYSLSIVELELEKLPDYGRPVYSPNGDYVVFVDYIADEYIMRLLETETNNLVELLRDDRWIGPATWLSEQEFYYEILDGKYLWDIESMLSAELTELNAYLQTQSSLPFSSVSLSPDLSQGASYEDIWAYRSATDFRVVDLTEEQFAELEAKQPTRTGSDIFDLQSQSVQHVDVNDQFVIHVEWSPSSQKIAIVTDWYGDDFGIYVYDLERRTIQRIADGFPSITSLYLPSWSPDGEWLAYKATDNYRIYHISNNESIDLAEQLEGLRIYWSPIMDYSSSQCK